MAFAQMDRLTAKDSLDHLDRMLSPTEMSKDLQTFLDIRKAANSGLYVYQTKEQVDSVYQWAFSQLREPMRLSSFFKILIKLTDLEGSCHNHTEPELDLMNFLKRQKAFFPYHLTYIDGKMIFDGHHASVPPGSRIVSVNGVSDKEIIKTMSSYFTTDGHTQTYKWTSSVERGFGWRYYMAYGLADHFTVEYTSPGSQKLEKIILPAATLEEQEQNRDNRYSAPIADRLDYRKQPPYGFEMIDSQTGLLNLRWFGMATGRDDPRFGVYVNYLDSVFRVLDQKKIPNLIIDIRNNPGGSDPTFEQPVMYLSDHQFKENLEAYINFDLNAIPYEEYFWGVTTSERIDSIALVQGMEFLRDYFQEFEDGKTHQNQKYNPVYHPKSPAYQGKVYLLINQNVASAASHFASLMKAYARNVTIVGVETQGGYYVHNGHIPFVYELPNSKIKTQFSAVYVVQDAVELDDQPPGRGIIPHHEVWPSLEDFLQHRDTQLEYVMKLIRE